MDKSLSSVLVLAGMVGGAIYTAPTKDAPGDTQDAVQASRPKPIPLPAPVKPAPKSVLRAPAVSQEKLLQHIADLEGKLEDYTKSVEAQIDTLRTGYKPPKAPPLVNNELTDLLPKKEEKYVGNWTKKEYDKIAHASTSSMGASCAGSRATTRKSCAGGNGSSGGSTFSYTEPVIYSQPIIYPTPSAGCRGSRAMFSPFASGCSGSRGMFSPYGSNY